MAPDAEPDMPLNKLPADEINDLLDQMQETMDDIRELVTRFGQKGDT